VANSQSAAADSVPSFLAGRDLLEISRDCEQHQRARRTAHQDHSDAIRPDLARSLNNLSASLADLGRREDALAAIEEAAQVYRELAARCLDAYYHQLEQSLRLADWL
jgi:hypothetical protein